MDKYIFWGGLKTYLTYSVNIKDVVNYPEKPFNKEVANDILETTQFIYYLEFAIDHGYQQTIYNLLENS